MLRVFENVCSSRVVREGIMRWKQRVWCGLLVLVAGCEKDGGGPKMQVETTNRPGAFATVTITSNDADSFTVERVVLNGRDNQKGCDSALAPVPSDFMVVKLPAKLQRGDATSILADCGDKILIVSVHTDRGVSSFQMNERANTGSVQIVGLLGFDLALPKRQSGTAPRPEM